MKNLLLPLLLFISIAGHSQAKRYLYYFDKDFGPTEKSKAVFYGTGESEEGLIKLSIYNRADEQLLVVQHFTDSALQTSEGLFQSYAANMLQVEGNYDKGKEDGLWQKWDSSGHVTDSTFYNAGTLTRYIHRGYYKSGFPDSVIISDMKTTRLSKIYYADSGVIRNEAFFTGEKGLLKYYDKGVYKSSDSVYSREEIEAEFPGGPAAWTKYIVSGLQKYSAEIYKDNVFGSCIVKFIINKEGKVTEARATNMQGSALADVAVRIIKNSPKWHPASQYGRKVNAYRLQPVTLMETN